MSVTEPGTYGAYGGQYVPETLAPALEELVSGWEEIRDDPSFRAELAELQRTYVGRPTPLYRAERIGEGRRIYLKREDLCHTGAHKINNAVGQALVARRLAKRRIVAETGAGQHGVAAATVCARFGLECVVYMGAEDMERQRPNVERMHLLGAEVRPVEFGTRKRLARPLLRVPALDGVPARRSHPLDGGTLHPEVLGARGHAHVGDDAHPHASARPETAKMGATLPPQDEAATSAASASSTIPSFFPTAAFATQASRQEGNRVVTASRSFIASPSFPVAASWRAMAT